MHKGYEELRAQLVAAATVVEKGAVYVHYKDLNSRYRVEELSIDEATDAVVVVYSPLLAPDIRFVRPLVSWLEEIKGRPRFKKI